MSPPDMVTTVQPANSPAPPSAVSRTPTSGTGAGTTSGTAADSLFEPSVEMMVNDFDDERTLEEEEALAATESEDPSAELSNLQRVRYNLYGIRAKYNNICTNQHSFFTSLTYRSTVP